MEDTGRRVPTSSSRALVCPAEHFVIFVFVVIIVNYRNRYELGLTGQFYKNLNLNANTSLVIISQSVTRWPLIVFTYLL